MSYRKILLPLSQSPGGEAGLRTGLGLAVAWGAHLAALIVKLDARAIAPVASQGLSASMIDDMMAASSRDSAARAALLSAQFTEAAQQAGVALDPAEFGLRASASLQVLVGDEEDVVPAQAKLADLTLLPQPNAEDDSASSDTLHNVLFESGRPVLLTPPQAKPVFGRRCCVAWNGTTESSAAVAAALPWLRAAKAVRILHAEEYQRRGPAATALLPYLALHGVQADIAEFKPVARDVGAGLLAAAAAFDADFLTMGAYSHSRIRQMILGGVTRHVMGHARMPVLMSR